MLLATLLHTAVALIPALLAVPSQAVPVTHVYSPDLIASTHFSDNSRTIYTHDDHHRHVRKPRSHPNPRDAFPCIHDLPRVGKACQSNADQIHQDKFPDSPCDHDRATSPTLDARALAPPPPPPPLASSLIVNIPELGDILGTSTLGNKIRRFTVPYAQPPVGDRRFKPTTPIIPWRTRLNGTRLPPICAQSETWSYTPSLAEDCLYLNIYTPTNIGPGPASSLPVFVWLHGGSFRAGSTSDPAIDGSRLALSGNMVVVTVQYRLGVFRFLRSSAKGVYGNMAVNDIITAIQFLQSHIQHFGGDVATLTLAGQSSGADLIKTLLATPSTDALFSRAILHSAPLNYGDHSVNTAEKIGSVVLDALSEECADIQCLQAASVQSLLAAQDFAMQSAPQTVPGVAAAAPLRPVIDGVLVKSNFMRVLNTDKGFSNTNRQMIFTTVKNEAGLTIDLVSQQQIIEPEYFDAYVQALMDAPRAETLLLSGVYVVDSSNEDGARIKLEELGTDWIWRCANQQAAVNITTHRNAPQVYLAEFDLGDVYADNANVAFCKGRVCHEDDIPVVFSTSPSPTPAQQDLSREITARWSAFARTGSPNTPSYTAWNAILTSASGEPQLNMLVLNPDGRSSVAEDQNRQACSATSGLWGRIIPFDEQLYADLKI